MKIIICDKCGCTDKPIGKAQIMAEGEHIFTDNIGSDFETVSHRGIEYDLCDICMNSYNKRKRENKDIFFGIPQKRM